MVLEESVAGAQGATVQGISSRQEEFGSSGVRGWIPSSDKSVCCEESKGLKMEHRVKTWPPFFKDALLGKKPFELRINDRDYQVGDTLLQEEFDPVLEDYTGMKFRQKITYVLRAEDIPNKWGLKEGWCILGLEKI